MLTIISGSPGAGKTTVCTRLAKNSRFGLHLPSDLFYTFPAFPVDPTQPESRVQNEAIIRSLGAASSSFLASGYEVILDGVIGPWFLSALLEEVDIRFSVAYCILTTNPKVAGERVRGRDGPGLTPRVLATHSSFLELGEYEPNRIDTTARSPDEVYREVADRMQKGDFTLR